MSHRLRRSLLLLLQFLELMSQLLNFQALFCKLGVLRLLRPLEFTQLIIKPGQLSPFVLQVSLGNIMGVL